MDGTHAHWNRGGDGIDARAKGRGLLAGGVKPLIGVEQNMLEAHWAERHATTVTSGSVWSLVFALSFNVSVNCRTSSLACGFNVLGFSMGS